MQRLILLMIFAVVTFPYLTIGDKWGRFRFLPGFTGFAPEILSAVAVVVVIAVGARDGFRLVRPAYWLLFGTLLLSMLCGILANHVDSGPVFAGLRLYLRALPWFFIPALYAFSEAQIRQQLQLLLGLSLLQVPIAIEQRIRTGAITEGFHAITGDWTNGTLNDAGILSIFLIAGSCVLLAFLTKHQMRFVRFLPLYLLVLLPTTINETKAVVIFMPVASLVALMSASEPGVRTKRLVVGVFILTLFGAIFVPVYDALNADRTDGGSSIGDFFSNQNNLQEYLSSDESVNPAAGPGRIDAITTPLRRLSADPVSLVFGYGIGNASLSSWGPSFSGAYATLYTVYMQHALARFLLELGVLGVLMVMLFYWLVLMDARRVASDGPPFFAALAAGWTGVVALLVIAMIYALIEVFPAISFLFFFYSGVIAAQRMRMRMAVGTPVTATVVPAPVAARQARRALRAGGL